MIQIEKSKAKDIQREIPTILDSNNSNEDIPNNHQSKMPLKVIEERKKSLTQPTVVRLEYKTGYNPSKGANVAYCLINKKFVEKSIQSGSKEIIEKYNQLTTLNTKDEHSFDIYIMSGESVSPYEFYANQITLYLQKWYKVLLNTIVCDFMKDERGIIYFLGVKSFTLVKDPNELMNIKPEKSLMKIKDEKNIKKFYKTWTCRLCLLPYPKSKITKIVTFKLLFKLKENLKKRGCQCFEHINNNIYNESLSCRVCDLCYELLVTEQELMEIQKTIALCTNINVPNDELITNYNQSPENLVRAPQKYKKLTQWRILFYFLKFYFFDYLAFPFKDGTEDKTGLNDKKDTKTNYKLAITLFNQRLIIPIFTETKHFISKDEVEVNSAKMFYFFSSESSNVKQILKNEEVDFRIILNNKWNEPLALCKTLCFSCYDDGVKEKPITSKIVLNFFSDYIKHFKCQLYLGLKNDGLVTTESLQLFCYKLPNPIYITDLDYYSYHSLPSDWHELFIPPDTHPEEDNPNEIDNEIKQLLLELEGKEKKKTENDDEIYDPYDLLVEIQNKNNIIEKINSIPIVIDKAFIEMEQEKRKKRPTTANLLDQLTLPKIDLNSFKKKKLSNQRLSMDSKHNKKDMEVQQGIYTQDIASDVYLAQIDKMLLEATNQS